MHTRKTSHLQRLLIRTRIIANRILNQQYGLSFLYPLPGNRGLLCSQLTTANTRNMIDMPRYREIKTTSVSILRALQMEPVIIVHGGAWAIPDSMAMQNRQGVKKAALKGLKLLLNGGSALDAVELAVMDMENNSVFDAGTGSALNAKGEVQMDAAIMDGSDLRAGSVACVQNIANPIKLARLVMDKTDHTMMVGPGADELAIQLNVPTVLPEQLITQEARKELETFTKYKSTIEHSFRQRSGLSHDTVGAVATDKHGNFAFATSTGGITGKQPGRVGDSPLIGCGGYADNSVGAVSTTGHGESITKVCLAHHIITLMKTGSTAQQAVEQSLSYMCSRVGGMGGAVSIDASGNIGLSFTTVRMAWCWARGSQLHYGLDPEEDFTEEIDPAI